MSSERDPQLMALFAEAETDLDDPGFRHELMRSIDWERRRTLVVWTAFVAATLVCVALLAAPLLAAAKMATSLLPNSLVSIEADWLQQLLAPVNSVAAAIALGFLALRKLYRRLFR